MIVFIILALVIVAIGYAVISFCEWVEEHNFFVPKPKPDDFEIDPSRWLPRYEGESEMPIESIMRDNYYYETCNKPEWIMPTWEYWPSPSAESETIMRDDYDHETKNHPSKP